MIKIQSQDTHQRMASAWIRNEVCDQVGAYFYFLVGGGLSGLNSYRVDSLWLIQHIQSYSFFNPKRSCL